jgi:glycine oxidase
VKQQPEFLIVGAGIHGCALALELARRGRRVLVLERSIPGAEASSAAAGILGPNLEFGEPGPLPELCRLSMELYPDWVARIESASGKRVGFARCGGLRAAFQAESVAALREQAESMAAAGLPAEWLEPAALRARVPGIGAQHGGLLLPREAQLEPRALMDALGTAARHAGARFASGPVERIDLPADPAAPVLVRDGGHAWSAARVVLAGGAWSASLPGAGLPEGAVQPARGQIVELASGSRPPGPVTFSERGYVVPRGNGTVLCGSTLEFVGFQKAVTAGGVHGILTAAIEMFPDLADLPISATWSGFRPYTADHLPILGPGRDPRLVFDTGHYRNGILLAPASARLLSELLVDGRSPVDLGPFSPARLSERHP